MPVPTSHSLIDDTEGHCVPHRTLRDHVSMRTSADYKVHRQSVLSEVIQQIIRFADTGFPVTGN
jgi:hypothetical protein